MPLDEGAQDFSDEAREREELDHPKVLGAPIPPATLTFSQHSLVVADSNSLIETFNAILLRLERLEELITDEKGRRHDGMSRSIDDGIITPWDFYRGAVERLILEIDELRAATGRPQP